MTHSSNVYHGNLVDNWSGVERRPREGHNALAGGDCFVLTEAQEREVSAHIAWTGRDGAEKSLEQQEIVSRICSPTKLPI